MPSPRSNRQPNLAEALLGLDPSDGRPVRGEGLVVALSGGVDSVVLLDLLCELRDPLELRLVAAHADHDLREESQTDLEFCRRLCEEWGVPFVETRLDLGHAGTGGLEAEARRQRYEFLEQVRAEQGLDLIATGHHRDDQIETLLLWLFRGSGLRGLRGIPPRSPRRLRPLRSFTRAEIQRHAVERGLQWREDRSNEQPVYLRNRVRLELLPLVEELFGAEGPQRLGEFARRATEELDTLEAMAARVARELTLARDGESISLERDAFAALPFGLQLHVLRFLLERIQPDSVDQRWNEAAFRRVLNFVEEGHPGRQMPLPGGGVLHLSRDEWTLEAPNPTEKKQTFTLYADTLPASGGMVNFPGEESAVFDAERVRFPLNLRRAEPGDRIRPAGMAGRKRLAELLREQGVPHHRRSSALVVEDADEIIWAVGRALAARAEPDESSRRLLRLQVVERAETPPKGPEGPNGRTVSE